MTEEDTSDKAIFNYQKRIISFKCVINPQGQMPI